MPTLMSKFLSTLISLALPMTGFAAEIVAHRGASFDAPENTLSSMKLAWEQGADGIELDIYLSKDGRIVVMHDKDTKRTTGKPGKIAELTWDEMSKLDAGSWKDARYAGEKIPTLESILATVGDGKRVFIEIKCGPEILPELKRVLSTSQLPKDRIVIIGFGLETMEKAKAEFPDLKVLFLHGWKESAPVPVQELITKARAAKLDGLDLQSGFPVSSEFVSNVKNAGLSLYVWTVDDLATAKRWADAGVDGITTNRPKFLRAELTAQAK